MYRARRLLLRGADPTSIIQQCSLAGCRLKESLQVSLHKSPQLMVQVRDNACASFWFYFLISSALWLTIIIRFDTLGVARVHCSCIARCK
jgi:hypothetical protein